MNKDQRVFKSLLCFIVFLAGFSASYGKAPREAIPKTDYSYRALDIAGLRRGFEKPPIEAGPWVYWFCFDNAITAQEMEREIKEMVAAGLGGAELRFVEFAWWREKEVVDKELAMVGHKRLEYLSDEFLEVLEHAYSVAERYGFKLSMNMGMGWPPGGTWITDEYRTKCLKSTMTVLEGGKAVGKDVKISVPKGGKVYAWRLEDVKEKSIVPNSFVDLSGHVRMAGAEGGVFWNAPAGNWLVGVYWLKNGGGLDKAYGYAADPGSKKAIDFHLNYLFDKIEPRLGKYFGTILTEMASDSWEYDGSPYWTPGMDEAFLNLNGYELAPRLYAMAGYGDDREKIMADIERTQQQLVNENFFIYTKKVLNSYGVGHRPQAYGRGLSRDLFEVYTNCDVPEIEEGVRLPEAVWVSHTLGKPITSVEALTFMSRHGNDVISPVVGGEQKAYGLSEPGGGWETNPAMLRSFSNAHYASGVNRMQMHSFGYSPDGVPLPGWRMYAEIHLNRNVSWWRYMNEYGTWSKRTQWILQSGRPIADSLVYPVESTSDGHRNHRVDEQPVSGMNCIDASSPYTFSRIWESDGGRYEIKNLCLIGDIKTLEEAEKILLMIKRGVKVTYCDVEPEKWTVFREYGGTRVVKALEHFKKALRQGRIVDGRQEGWKKVLEKNRSVRWYPEDGVLTYLHRRLEGGEAYFIMNCGDEFDGEVEFDESGLVPQIWDADTGRINDCGQWRIIDGKVRVKMRIGHLESAVVVFVKGKESLHAVESRGGRIERDGGRLYAILEDNVCKVKLSDGRVRKLKAKIPEEISLDDGWKLFASDKEGVGVKGEVEIKLDKLVSWRQLSEVSRYSGMARYEVTFDVSSEMLKDDLLVELDLGKVYEVAEVWVNGKRVGVSWYPPNKVDITGHLKRGRNELRIDVANVLKNYLTEGDYSRPSGLLGPVKIRGISKILLNE
ncbi:MAG: glycosyl hydrolase [Planctomycetota bacterium]